MNYNEKELCAKLNRIIKLNWIKSINNYSSGAGLTLEYLLGKEEENFEYPDYNGIEIKTKYSKREKYLKLFCATPDSYLLETHRLLKNYGYPDKTTPEFKVLNISVFSNKNIYLNNKYIFNLSVDRINKKIVLNVYDSDYKLLENNCQWSFDMLFEKLTRKFETLAYIKAERKYENKSQYFKYTSYKIYKLKNTNEFLNLLESGGIKITFSIGVFKNKYRYGQIHDRGTSFSIYEDKLDKLFN